MLKKSITYHDFNGETVTDDFYFNLNEDELIELELSHKDGLAEGMKRIMDAKDMDALYKEFKRIIFMSYGRKSADGKRFIKNQELRDDFQSTRAYSELIMEFITNAEVAAEFINGIMPENFVQRMAQLKIDGIPEETTRSILEPEPKKLSPTDILEMDGDELKSGLATGKYVI